MLTLLKILPVALFKTAVGVSTPLLINTALLSPTTKALGKVFLIEAALAEVRLEVSILP